jgi:hypothetical protein
MIFIQKIQVVIVASVLGLLTLVGGIVLVGLNNGSSTVDSGVLACKEIVENASNPSTSDSSSKMTDAQRKEKRKPFENSDYADIRTAGTAFVDVVYKIDNLPTESTNEDEAVAAGEELGTAIGSTTLLTSHYNLLQNACANHGIQLPSIS